MALATNKTSIVKDYMSLNITIVGAPKVGKSTLAANIGEPGSVYFAGTEQGHNFLEVFKSDINSWADFELLVKDLTTTKHGFKHLVIDVIDKLYEYACDEICARNKVKQLSDIGFGGGYTAVKKMMLGSFETINKSGIGLTMITHEKTKELKKDSISWTAAGTSLPNAIENSILGMCDLILFAHISKEGKNSLRTKATKFIYAAGDRSGKLPEVMPMDGKLLIETLKK